MVLRFYFAIFIARWWFLGLILLFLFFFFLKHLAPFREFIVLHHTVHVSLWETFPACFWLLFFIIYFVSWVQFFVPSPKLPWKSVPIPLFAITLIWNLIFLVDQTVQVHDLLILYNDINVPPERLLFKIPSTWQVSIWAKYVFIGNLTTFFETWYMDANESFHSFVAHLYWLSIQGIEASRLLESEGIQTHLTFVYRYTLWCIKWLKAWIFTMTIQWWYDLIIVSKSLSSCCYTSFYLAHFIMITLISH